MAGSSLKAQIQGWKGAAAAAGRKAQPENCPEGQFRQETRRLVGFRTGDSITDCVDRKIDALNFATMARQFVQNSKKGYRRISA